MTSRGFLAGLALSTVVLAGCGDDGRSSSAPQSSPPTSSAANTPSAKPGKPQCDAVWVEAQKLPAGYDGCFTGADKVAADRRPCSFGRPLITYAGRFYAVPTGTIHEVDGPLQEDRGYRSAMKSCMA